MIFSSLALDYSSSKDMKGLVDRIEGSADPNFLEGIPTQSFPYVLAALFCRIKRPLIIISKNNAAAQDLALSLGSFLPENIISTFPSYDLLPYEFISPIEKIERERIAAIHAMLHGGERIIIISVEALLRNIPSIKILEGKELSLTAGAEYSFETIIIQLTDYGYTRVSRVEGYGQFTVKGGIIDIYPPSFENPVRLDFFGDTLEAIRTFSIETQTSIAKINTISIFPRKELILTGAEKSDLCDKLKAEYVKGKKIPDQILHSLEKGEILDEIAGIEDLFPLVMKTSNIKDLFPENSLIVSIEPNELETQAESIMSAYHSLYVQKSRTSVALHPDELLSYPSFKTTLGKSLRILQLTAHTNAAHFDIKSAPVFKGKLTDAREEFKRLIDEGWKIYIATAFEGQARRICDLFKEFEPNDDFETINDASKLNIALSTYPSGFLDYKMKKALFTDQDIFGKSYRSKRSFKRRSSQAINSFMELVPGDHIVHVNHGIGIFKNIERMSAGGTVRDFLVIEYADSDKLYVALDQLNMVQRYTGLDGREPRLDALGKKSAWNRIKARVQETVDEIAEELIAIYAKRKAIKGTQFPPDTAWQEEFEARFEYEETPDQMSAIEDVKDDMEKPQPMDRLVCGDVGFGKTEVAIRAAFKASMAGKQTAILVPTTILAMQHFNTFRKRFAGYPVQIEMISRFRHPKEIKEVKAKLTNGQVDIVIGTHALLSADVYIKNLGLLIIDEEQRFGVKHKEKLKKYRSQVDVLTLSATPIPRTLHMSLAGIRDLSIIETPPENRQAIETYVLEDNPDIMKMAIEREIDRGGQIFYIHNRVQTIDAQAEMLLELVPRARIAIAHGQMDEFDLENIMIDFLNGMYDILLSTTIIESGLDMPHVNTIIISRADAFGLSQLYQLKGRVGRSSVKGYAYFFYPRHIALTETAQKRLNVISEFSDLGSGFKIAMKDLEIRGTGNILGKEQSGCIMDVGFDLYCALLEEAVRKLKGEKPLKVFRTIVYLGADTYISDEYIPDIKQKVEFYKRFESCETLEEVNSLALEIKDRFGEAPYEVETMIEIERIRAIASSLFIEEIYDSGIIIRIKIGEECTIDMKKIAKLLNTDKRYRPDPSDPRVLLFQIYEKVKDREKEEDIEKKITEIKKWLQQMV